MNHPGSNHNMLPLLTNCYTIIFYTHYLYHPRYCKIDYIGHRYNLEHIFYFNLKNKKNNTALPELWVEITKWRALMGVDYHIHVLTYIYKLCVVHVLYIILADLIYVILDIDQMNYILLNST